MKFSFTRAAVWAVLAGAPGFAQHTFTPFDVEEGMRLYKANCTNCHGADGQAISGVDLSHNQFRRASTNDDLEELIIKGIPGTAMPSHNFTEREAFQVVLYLREMSKMGEADAAPAGDAARGKAIFEGKGACTSCHRVRGTGARTGPDLSDIGALRRVSDLRHSLEEPDAEIRPENRYLRAILKNGTQVNGRILNQDTFYIQLIDSNEKLRNIAKSDLKQASILEKSPMPSYAQKLTKSELDDLVSYLVSLKGVNSK